MSERRLWPVLLFVPLGLVTGHQAVYAALHTHASGAGPQHTHGHIAVLGSLAIPLAAAGAAWLARRSNRELIVPALAVLAAAQVVAFAAMETVELLAVGGELGTLARSPVLWAGVAFQVALAVAVGVGLRGAGWAATAVLLRSATAMTPAPRGAFAPPPSNERPPRPLPVTTWLHRRGPPTLLGS